MLHESLTSLIDRQQRLLKRSITWLFSLAGVYWFAIWLAHDATVRHPHLRSTHYSIYMILLTLWGFAAMRERRRLQTVITAANARGCAPQQVTADDLRTDGTLSAFSILTPVGNSPRVWIPIGFTLVLLITSATLLLLQYARLVF